MNGIINEVLEYCQNDMEYLQEIIDRLQEVVDNSELEKKEAMIVFILDNEKEEVKDKIEKCLETLYWLEDFTEYEQPKIGKCINLLQDIEIKMQEEMYAK